MSTPFDTRPGSPTQTVRQATDRSKAYMRDLALDKAAHENQDLDVAAMNIDAWLLDRSQDAVSEQINRLKREGYTGSKYRGKQTEKAEPTATPLPSAEEVPEGYYALPTEPGAKNAIAFYKVDRPTEGRWAGYVFAHRYSSDEEISLGRAGSHRLIRKIAEFGARASSLLYGSETQRCGICHRKLTNDDSRARGIGPDCAAKLGW